MYTVGAAFRIQPGAKLHPWHGIRTAVAALVPLIILAAMHQLQIGVAAAFGALLVAFSDIGGSVRTRVAASSTTVLVGTFLFALGRVIGQPWWLAVPAICLATLAAGLVGVHGRAVAQVAVSLNLIFVIALGADGGLSVALPSALGFLIGGISAILFALAPWLARRLRLARPDPHALPEPVQAPMTPLRQPSLSSFLASLTPRSPAFSFAALRAAGATVAASVAWWWGIPRPHWAVVPVLLCVLPRREASLVMTAQVTIGTVAGVLVAAMALLILHDPLGVAVIAAAVLALEFTVRELNRALFMFFQTIMLLLVLSLPIAGLSLVALKLLEVLLGVTIALAVTYLASRASTPTTPEPSAPGVPA